MDLKAVGATKLLPLIRAGYDLRRRGISLSSQSSWWYDNIIARWANHMASAFISEPITWQNKEDLKESAKLFVEWVVNEPHEVDMWLASKSPAVLAKLSVSNRTRLGPDAEKLLFSRAKDKAGLIDYCSHFGIIMDDLTKVTMKAAFDGNARREKAYIKKIEDTKRNLRGFLVQLVNVGQVDPKQTVEDLLKNM